MEKLVEDIDKENDCEEESVSDSRLETLREIRNIQFENEMANPKTAVLIKNNYNVNATPDQQSIIDEIREALINPKLKRRFVIQGIAGTGKSFVVSAICDMALSLGKTIKILAPTGIAASLINGTTIHSCFGINICKSNKIDRARPPVKEVDLYVIDEYSMMSKKLLDSILPFIRKTSLLILSGDPRQLAPIGSTVLPDWVLMYAYSFKILRLYKSMRQNNDIIFQVFLSRIADGRIDTLVKFVIACRYLNDSGKIVDLLSKTMPVLVATNKEKDIYNKSILDTIKSSPFIHRPIMLYNDGKEVMDSNIRKNVLNEYNINELLEVKIGCSVMLTRNMSVSAGWVNGSFGILREIRNINSKNPVLIIRDLYNENKTISLKIQTLEVKGYDDEIEYIIKYFPLVLAYSITIHKSQGQTLDQCLVSLKKNPYMVDDDYNRLCYVSFSRVRTAKNLFITNTIFSKFEDMTLKEMMEISEEDIPSGFTKEDMNLYMSEHRRDLDMVRKMSNEDDKRFIEFMKDRIR